MSRLAEIWRGALIQLSREPRVAWLGLLGVALGGLCALVGLVRGFDVLPEGNLWETATFNGAIGVFHLTQAALAPAAGFTERGQRWWATALIVTTLYAYGIETVQAFRGLDPRFSAVAGPADQILAGVFFLDALLIMALFLILAWRFFSADVTPVRLAVRYAAAACVLAFGVGISMSIVTQGRMVGIEGNLLPIHAAGFHGLQAIPLVALLFAWGGPREALARRWVHVAGIAWLGICGAVLWQAGAGWNPLEATPAMLMTLVFVGGWAIAAATGVRAFYYAAREAS